MAAKMIDFYTDGSCSNKTFAGGWAMLGIDRETNEILYSDSGNSLETTNNRMELTAFLKALQVINSLKEDGECCGATIFTDSSYIANAFNQKWYAKWQLNRWRTADKRPVKNQDLWKEMLVYYIRIINKQNFSFSIEKIKAHSGDEWNETVDYIAVGKRTDLEKEIEE